MSKAKTTVEEAKLIDMFAEADSRWVCPITGKKFDRSDVTAIEDHKATVIRDIAAKNEVSRKMKLETSLRKEGEKLTTLTGFRKWLVKRFAAAGKEITEDQIKLETVKADGMQKKADFRFDSSRLQINLIGAAAISADDLKKIGIIKGVFELPNSPLRESLGVLARKKTPDSLSQEQMVTLREGNKSYCENVERMHELRSRISEIRKQINDLEDKNQKTRKEFLADTNHCLVSLG